MVIVLVVAELFRLVDDFDSLCPQTCQGGCGSGLLQWFCMFVLQLFVLHLLSFQGMSSFLEVLPLVVGDFAEAFVDLVLSTAESACCTLYSSNLVTITH